MVMPGGRRGAGAPLEHVQVVSGVIDQCHDSRRPAPRRVVVVEAGELKPPTNKGELKLPAQTK
jgi:hypothetical protein